MKTKASGKLNVRSKMRTGRNGRLMTRIDQTKLWTEKTDEDN